jgi:molecular chaperone GrpE
LRSSLQRFGVSEVNAKGLPFDPAVHEALSSEDSKDMPAGHVVRVFKKPYKLHDKLIRPGQVVVAKQGSQ